VYDIEELFEDMMGAAMAVEIENMVGQSFN
jgi:hypothetical protein